MARKPIRNYKSFAVNHLTFWGGCGRFEKKNSYKAFTVKIISCNMNGYEKHACTALKQLPVPLVLPSEKKNSCTTLPLLPLSKVKWSTPYSTIGFFNYYNTLFYIRRLWLICDHMKFRNTDNRHVFTGLEE